MNTTSEAVSITDPYPFENFAPTLSQCFVIVISGYLMARFEILSASEVKGVNCFATYFAMPGIICISLADADFDDFRWELLVGIFLGKLLIFILVAGVFLLLNTNIGIAGLSALFCVHSNDLPVGNPLMSALYRDYRPHMSKYLFFIPSMTVIFFVPVGNIMIQIHKNRRKEESITKHNTNETKCTNNIRKFIFRKEHLKHFTELVKHPVVLATVLGLVLNVAFDRQMPKALHRPIQVMAATIPGLALAILGFNMVRKERYLISSCIVLAAILIFVKMLFTPILLHTVMKVLTDDSRSSEQLSDFALLYGIISPATAIFQTGMEFRKPLAAMGAALILTSFMCFPVSYVVARNTIATAQNLNSFVPLLKRVLFWTACFSILCNVTVCFMIVFRKQHREIPYNYVMLFSVVQLIMLTGILFWYFADIKSWYTYCQMMFYYGGEISCYLWSCILAIVLISKEKHIDQIKNAFRLLSFIIISFSALIVVVVCLLIPHNTNESIYVVGKPKPGYETHQLITTTILLFVCVATLSASLLHHFKSNRKDEIQELPVYDNTVFYIEEQDESMTNSNMSGFSTTSKSLKMLTEKEENEFYYENTFGGRRCQSNFHLNKREWAFRFTSLIIILWITLMARFIANLYKLIQSKSLEILVPMEFLQSILFVSQGFFMLLTFGVDVRTITISFRKWWRRITNQKENIANIDLSEEVTVICKQFCNYYYFQCFQDLAKERRWKGVTYKDSFWGHQLVDWMISEGLCKDDLEAEETGQKLLAGGIIGHVAEAYNFHDAPLLYYFLQSSFNYEK